MNDSTNKMSLESDQGKGDGLSYTQRYDNIFTFIETAHELSCRLQKHGPKNRNVFALTTTFSDWDRHHRMHRLNKAAARFVMWIAKRHGEGGWMVAELDENGHLHFHGIAFTTRTKDELAQKWLELTDAEEKAVGINFVWPKGDRRDPEFKISLGRVIQYRTTHAPRLLRVGMSLRERTFVSGCLADLWRKAFGWESADPDFDLSGLDHLPPEPKPSGLLPRDGRPNLCLECKKAIGHPEDEFCDNKGCRKDYMYRRWRIQHGHTWWDQWVCDGYHCHGHSTWKNKLDFGFIPRSPEQYKPTVRCNYRGDTTGIQLHNVDRDELLHLIYG